MSDTIILHDVEEVIKVTNSERMIIPNRFRDKSKFELVLVVKKHGKK